MDLNNTLVRYKYWGSDSRFAYKTNIESPHPKWKQNKTGKVGEGIIVHILQQTAANFGCGRMNGLLANDWQPVHSPAATLSLLFSLPYLSVHSLAAIQTPALPESLE